MASHTAAKAKYSEKICVNYLGISANGCDKAFDELVKGMTAGYAALAGGIFR